MDYGYLTPFPRFSSIRNAQKTKLLQLAEIAVQGDMARALAGLQEDMEFWRLVSRNSATLISKIIALASLQADLRLVAELGTSLRLNAVEMQMVQEILRPFADAETSFVATLRGEARYSYRGTELSYRQALKSWDPANLLFKPNATQNRTYADFQELIRLAELPPQEFARKLIKQQTEKTGRGRIGLPLLYNYFGELLASNSALDIPRYIMRGHNLEGFRRLAHLKIMAHKEHVQPEQMPRFLASQTRDFGNPYTGEAMIWDEKKRSISFKDLTEEETVELYL